MSRSDLLLRILLVSYALMSLLGSVWYFGDRGTYAGLIFALSALTWTFGWRRASFTLFNVTSATCALVAVCWMFAAKVGSVLTFKHKLKIYDFSPKWQGR